MTYPEVAVHQGCCLETLKGLPAESVHMVCTSPPYWSLRDYQTGRWEGGSAECDHVEMACGMSEKNTLGHGASSPNRFTLPATNAANVGRQKQYRDTCSKCGALRIDQQIGLEPTADEWIAKMVEVFAEVKRVLRRDGTVWLNVGDAYACAPNGNSAASYKGKDDRTFRDKPSNTVGNGFKAKDLMMLPHRLAIALQNDGWWIRQAITWCKPSPMPESVTDRCTSATEMLFMLTKAERYFYDAEAIREPVTGGAHSRGNGSSPKSEEADLSAVRRFRTVDVDPSAGRNKRNWWVIPSEAYPDAHFATFPRALVRPCILAGTSAEGACGSCGSPWVRQIVKEYHSEPSYKQNGETTLTQGRNRNVTRMGDGVNIETTGWIPSCDCCECMAGNVQIPYNVKGGINTDATRGQRGTESVPSGVGEAEMGEGFGGTEGSQKTTAIQARQDMRTVPDCVQGDEAVTVLRHEVCESISHTNGEAQSFLDGQHTRARSLPRGIQTTQLPGMEDDAAGIPDDLEAGAPNGAASGICSGASVRNGGIPGKSSAQGRACSPHQRHQDGQQDREPRITVTERPQSVAVSEVSSLRPKICRRCGQAIRPPRVVPCTVLDPFAGSGTVGEVALSLGRSAVLCELNEEYCKLIEKRLSRAQVPLALGI